MFCVAGEAGKELYVKNTVDLRNVRNSELIMRLETDVVTPNESFYTDHMGLQVRLLFIIDGLLKSENDFFSY